MCEYCERQRGIHPIEELGGPSISIVPPQYEPATIIVDEDPLDTYMLDVPMAMDSYEYPSDYGVSFYKIYFCPMCGRKL